MTELEKLQAKVSFLTREVSRVRARHWALAASFANVAQRLGLGPVVGGEETPAGELDHCCAIGVFGAGWTDSGVLVHPSLVLTAAHVGEAGGHSNPDRVALRVTRVTAPDLSMVPTDPNLVAGPQITAGKFSPHPQFQIHDIGSIILAHPSIGTPIAGLASAAEMVAATEVTLAGFGTEGNLSNEGIKRDVVVDIQFLKGGTMGPFASAAARQKFDPDLEFVVGTAVKGACFGDSGGPAYIQVDGHLKVAGIISRGDDRCDGFTVCSRIDVSVAWIESRIAAISGSI